MLSKLTIFQSEYHSVHKITNKTFSLNYFIVDCFIAIYKKYQKKKYLVTNQFFYQSINPS